MWFYVIVAVVGYYAFCYFLQTRYGKCTSKADLTGKTVIVTGASAGM
jgi:hypothetical protein